MTIAYRKLFLFFMAVYVLTLATLVVRYPDKNEHVFENDRYGMRIETYHERRWIFLSPKDWGMDLFIYNRVVGCGGLGRHSYGVRRFGFLGLAEEQGWQTTKAEWKRVQKIKEKKG